MSSAKHTVAVERGRTRANRVRAVVRLSTGAVQEHTEANWLEAWAHRSNFDRTAERAERLVNEIRSSTKVTLRNLGVSIVAIDVFVDERTTWVEEHEILVPTRHAQHRFGDPS